MGGGDRARGGALADTAAAGAGGGRLSYFHYDHLGSPLVISDGNGAAVEKIRHYPYGEIRGRFGAAGNPLPAPSGDEVRYEFTGHETELNTGLIYAGARFLDPVSGMFLTQDPAAQYLNPYAYGPWDPVNGTDPTGLIFGPILGYLFANLWWIALVAGAVASFAQALANGANFGQALGAAAVGAGIGLVTGGILGGIGEAITNEALKNVYATALIAAGVGNTAHGFAEGQAITASVGAAMLALGLVAGVTQGECAGVSQHAQLKINAQDFGQQFRVPSVWQSIGRYVGNMVRGEILDVAGGIYGTARGLGYGLYEIGAGIATFDGQLLGKGLYDLGSVFSMPRLGSHGGLNWPGTSDNAGLFPASGTQVNNASIKHDIAVGSPGGFWRSSNHFRWIVEACPLCQ